MIEITSAMVLAACDAYRKSARRKPVNGSYVEDMRNALEAALRAAPASPAERQGPGPGNTTEHLSDLRESGWRPIESAPKDGTLVLLLSAYYESEDPWPEAGADPIIRHRPKVHLGQWNPEGDSWVDQHGLGGGECYTLAVTGTWSSGGGWFEPHEVTHWMPLPSPPDALSKADAILALGEGLGSSSADLGGDGGRAATEGQSQAGKED